MSRRRGINLVGGEKSATCEAGGLLLTPFNNHSKCTTNRAKGTANLSTPCLYRLLLRFY